MLPDLDKQDAESLATCLRDVVALSTLPALWSGAEPVRIAESLAAALTTTLSAKFVYAAVKNGDGVPAVTVAQTDRYETSPALAEKIGPVLLDWARTRDPDELLVMENPIGEGVLNVATRPLGHYAELGLIAAGFEGLPTAAHHLALNIGANQAATGVRNALLFKSLRDSEERFRALVDASAQIVWTAAPDGSVVEDSPTWRAFTGQTLEQWKGFGWLEAIHPEDRRLTRELWLNAVRKGASLEAEYRLRHASGEWRHTTVRTVPRLDSTGTVREWVGMNVDITYRKSTEKAKELLVAELNHRVKNTLTVIQSIAEKTARQAKTQREFVTSFRGRLHALARVHTQLSDTNWEHADLHALVYDQLLQTGGGESSISAAGPRVTLDPQVATNLGMVLHELGTNSRKYGALSTSAGTVSVIWSVVGNLLQLQWTEHGGPSVSAPIQPGFGTALITQTAAAYGGAAHMHCTSQGVNWDISWSLPPLNVVPFPDSAAQASGAQPPAGEHDARARGGGDAPTLADKRILVVEDEILVAMDIVAGLQAAKAVPVGPCSTVAEALKAIETNHELDAALLDANLRNRSVEEIAAALTRRNVPFAFVTGYGRHDLPLAFRAAPVISKPFVMDDLIERTVGLITAAQSGAIPLHRRARGEDRDA